LSLLCRVFTITYLKQIMLQKYTILQLQFMALVGLKLYPMLNAVNLYIYDFVLLRYYCVSIGDPTVHFTTL